MSKTEIFDLKQPSVCNEIHLIESISNGLLANDPDIRQVMHSLSDSHKIIDEAEDTIIFLTIWQNMLIETLAGIWLEKLDDECKKQATSIEIFITDEGEKIFRTEVQKIIQSLPDIEQKKLKRFGIVKAVAKIFGILKPLNAAGVFWYSKSHLLRNRHLVLNGSNPGNNMGFCFRNKFMSIRNAPFNDLHQSEYDYLLDYINMVEHDKSCTVYKYPPERYQQAHIQFWENNFDIIASYIVDSGKGLATKDIFIPANILCFYSGYLYRGKGCNFTQEQSTRALVLRKNKLYIIAETSDYPGFLNYYYTQKGNQEKDYNHFRIVKSCPKFKAQGKILNLGFIETQLNLKPNTECFLNYDNDYETRPVKMHNQLQFTDLHYDVENADIDQLKGYACRHAEFFDDKSSFYSTILKDIKAKEGSVMESSEIAYSSMVNTPLMQIKEPTFFTNKISLMHKMYAYSQGIPKSILIKSNMHNNAIVPYGPLSQKFSDNFEINAYINDNNEEIISEKHSYLNKNINNKSKITDNSRDNITAIIPDKICLSDKKSFYKGKKQNEKKIANTKVSSKNVVNAKIHNKNDKSKNIIVTETLQKNQIIIKEKPKRVTKRKDDDWEDIEEVNNCEKIEKSEFVQNIITNYSPKYRNIKFQFDDISGRVCFSNYNLDYLSRHSKASYTDIVIIIGIPEIHNKINSLIAVGASCFSQTESITYLCNKINKLKTRHGDQDKFIHLFADEMITQLNNARKRWKLFSAIDTRYGNIDDFHVRTIVTIVTVQRSNELEMINYQYDISMFLKMKENCEKKLFTQRPVGFCHDTNIHAIAHIINNLQINPNSCCLEFGCGYPIFSCCLAMISKKIVDAVDIDETIDYILQTIDIITNSENEYMNKFEICEEDLQYNLNKIDSKSTFKRIKLEVDDTQEEILEGIDEKTVSSDSSSSTSLDSSVYLESDNIEDTDSVDETDNKYKNNEASKAHSSSGFDSSSESDKS